MDINDAQNHPQWLTWKKWNFRGLQPIQSLLRIKHIMQILD